jgi:hypothetical protein
VIAVNQKVKNWNLQLELGHKKKQKNHHQHLELENFHSKQKKLILSSLFPNYHRVEKKKCIFSSHFHCSLRGLRWEVLNFFLQGGRTWGPSHFENMIKSSRPSQHRACSFRLKDSPWVGLFGPIYSRQTKFNISWVNWWKSSTKFNCFLEIVNQSGQTRAPLYSWMFPASSKLFHFLLNYSKKSSENLMKPDRWILWPWDFILFWLRSLAASIWRLHGKDQDHQRWARKFQSTVIFSAFPLGKEAIVRTLSVCPSQLLVFRELTDWGDLWLDRKLMSQGSELW